MRVACQLAEVHVLNDGFDGTRGYNFEHFDCLGKLE